MTAIPTSATGGFNQPRENTQLRTAPTRGARTRPLPRRNYCPGAFARWRAVADPHRTPPQEIRVETWIELVGMLATALRAGLLNSPQSVTHSGACDELNLLINARMGVGHAGVAIKRSSCRQRHGVGSFRLTDSFSQKYVLTAKRCWWRPGALFNFLYLQCRKTEARVFRNTSVRPDRTGKADRGGVSLVDWLPTPKKI